MPENRILLVEDEPTTREILSEVLRGEGYGVDSVATAGAATTCLGAISYALVIADWVLPDGDGVDVADAAAQLGCKTVVISGYLGNLPAGAADRHQLFAKPLSPTDIIVAVHQSIGQTEREHLNSRASRSTPRLSPKPWCRCRVARLCRRR